MKIFTAYRQTFTSPGRAINLDQGDYDQITIDHCQFTNTGGIFIQAKVNCKIVIQNCTFKEIIKVREMEYAQAIQVSGLGEKGSYNPVPCSIKILNNTITNTPGVSDVEDCINLIMVTGISGSPLHLSGNSISGAYPRDLKTLPNYSGGGILCDRGCGYALIEHNVVTETNNYGIAIAGGSNNQILNNKVTALHAVNVGIYIANQYPKDPFKNNTQSGNTVSWKRSDGTFNNYWLP